MDGELFDRARAVRGRAYAGYSKVKVGVALRTASGEIHAGTNVENAAFPEGWCAETSAIAHMVGAAPPGRGRRIVEVTIVATPIDGRLVSPCGGCRQRLAEFGTGATMVNLVDPSGKGSESWRLDTLLPAAFALEGKP